MLSQDPPFPSKALLMTPGRYRITWPAPAIGKIGQANKYSACPASMGDMGKGEGRWQ